MRLQTPIQPQVIIYSLPLKKYKKETLLHYTAQETVTVNPRYTEIIGLCKPKTAERKDQRDSSY